MKSNILKDRVRNIRLNIFGYVKLPIIPDCIISDLLTFYNNNIQFNGFFYNSILSSDLDIRLTHNNTIKNRLSEYLNQQLKPYRLIMATFFSKNKSQIQSVGPHQDPTTVNFLESDDFIIWIPLVDTVAVKSGRISVKPFSQLFYSRINFSKVEYFQKYIFNQQHRLLNISLKKGEPIIMYNNLIHSSELNCIHDCRPAISLKVSAQSASIASYHILDWDKKLVDIYLQSDDDYYVKYGWDESKKPDTGVFYKRVKIN